MSFLEKIAEQVLPASMKKTVQYIRPIPESVAAPTEQYERVIDREAPTRPYPQSDAIPVSSGDKQMMNRENHAHTQLFYGIEGDVDLRSRRMLSGSQNLEEFTLHLELMHPTPELRHFFTEYYRSLIDDPEVSDTFTNAETFEAAISGMNPQVADYFRAQFPLFSNQTTEFAIVNNEITEQYIQDELKVIITAIHTAAMHTVNAPAIQEAQPKKSLLRDIFRNIFNPQ